jgi:hypothetical protein
VAAKMLLPILYWIYAWIGGDAREAIFSPSCKMINIYFVLTRLGADYFESLLIDHDVCSNYGNWNSAAGLTGLSSFRLQFNVEVFLSQTYDTHVFSCDYIRWTD